MGSFKSKIPRSLLRHPAAEFMDGAGWAGGWGAPTDVVMKWPTGDAGAARSDAHWHHLLPLGLSPCENSSTGPHGSFSEKTLESFRESANTGKE